MALRHILRTPGHHLVLFAADTTDSATLAAWQASAHEAMAGHGEVHVITRGHLPHDPMDGVFADLRSQAHNRYGVRRPSLYLIRPDKYVGYRGDSVDFAPVSDYFRALGVRPAIACEDGEPDNPVTQEPTAPKSLAGIGATALGVAAFGQAVRRGPGSADCLLLGG
ncbi:hypothetical protein [Nonomuraea sp. SBT364]|uniref:hypothetical protein n=1 Tax=Nonomuraea sp. SBT364 TaxID=1580530 RepID=UPI00066A340C|nr:hypothetical protein [Nonomuraea sp. SBT364]